MYARSIEGMRRRENRVKRWFGVERGEGFFDRITVISVEFILRQCFGVMFYKGFVLIELSRSADFRFAVAERKREFLSVVSCKLYNTFVLVRDNSLCSRRKVFNESIRT